MERLKALQQVRAELGTARLVAISKGESIEAIQSFYEAGQRDFGENRLPEVEAKRALLPSDINWHFIGSLQSKKVPKVVGRFALIHSVDSLDLAKKISQVSCEKKVVSRILLQVNTSGEATKHGFTPEACRAQFAEILALPSLEIKGLMTMAPLTDDEMVILSCFSALSQLFSELKAAYSLSDFIELSMGMSHDFRLAVRCGATLVRIGSYLFRR